jgi:hypothetical protein
MEKGVEGIDSIEAEAKLEVSLEPMMTDRH